MRNRTGPQRQRTNGDENAASKHIRQSSSIAVAAAAATRGTHSLVNVHVLKNGPSAQRAALGEVTTTAINRKVRKMQFLLSFGFLS